MCGGFDEQMTGPPDSYIPDPNKQNRTAVGWVCNSVDNFEDSFAMNMLSTLLLDGTLFLFFFMFVCFFGFMGIFWVILKAKKKNK